MCAARPRHVELLKSSCCATWQYGRRLKGMHKAVELLPEPMLLAELIGGQQAAVVQYKAESRASLFFKVFRTVALQLAEINAAAFICRIGQHEAFHAQGDTAVAAVTEIKLRAVWRGI